MRRPHRNEGRRPVRLGMLLPLLACLATVAQAQQHSGIDPLGRSGLPSLPTVEEQPSKPPVVPILPPLPPAIPEERQRLPQHVRVLVRQLLVSVYSAPCILFFVRKRCREDTWRA